MIQGLSYPLNDSSLRLTMPKHGLSLDIVCHPLHGTTFGGRSRMVLHLSGSSFLNIWDVTNQGVSLLFRLFIFFQFEHIHFSGYLEA